MKFLLMFIALLFLCAFLVDYTDNLKANQYNQMIRTCELTLTDGGKCTLIAAPIVEKK